jgi:release factor glutamine methyltransferase
MKEPDVADIQTRSDLFAKARAAFQAAFFPDAAFDARVLVAGLLEIEPQELVLRGDVAVDADMIARIENGIARRLAHEPVHRILGAREFYGMELAMSPGTLEPRPDSEMLVNEVLASVRAKGWGDRALRLLDLGTGTGAIMLGLLSELPRGNGLATDISADAVDTSVRNAATHGFAERFAGIVSNWLDDVDGVFDVIVSNPPYIASHVVTGLDEGVRGYDPIVALDGGADGLDAYRAIAGRAMDHLAGDGILAVEIGYDQKNSVSDLFEMAGFALVRAVQDFGGQDRVLVFSR